jgi:hypothetical protein
MLLRIGYIHVALTNIEFILKLYLFCYKYLKKIEAH